MDTPACQLNVEPDGVAVIETSPPGGRWNPGFAAALSSALDAVRDDPRIDAAVLCLGSARGVSDLDMHWLHACCETSPDAERLEAEVSRAHTLARRIAQSTKPVVALLDGMVAGPVAELAMACRERVATRSVNTRIAFSLSRFGLPPMLGITEQLSRRVGAAADALLQGGKETLVAQALKIGLIDVAVPAEDAIAEARRRARALADGTVRQADAASAAASDTPRAATAVPSAPPATPATSIDDAQRPAGRAIAASLADANSHDAGAAQDRDLHRFVDAALSPIGRAMVRTLAISVDRADRLERRPPGVPRRRFDRVGVLGAGLMGSGIACVCARAGLQVVLIDRDIDAAERGVATLRQQEAAAVAAGREDADISRAWLERIVPSADYADLATVDIVVEAVFEDRAVKADATRRAERHMRAHALFATNTSTLPIGGLAEASERPDRFIGLHFFSPVPRMPLLEVIRGAKTSDTTLAEALDFAQAIRKTPIIVNDSRGFFTSRVIMTYQSEAFEMLAEGVAAQAIEEAGSASGMPLPPLLLSDAVALDLIHQINLQTRRDTGSTAPPTRAQQLVGRMVEQHHRLGKKNGKGFYDYAADGGKRLWPELRAALGIEADTQAADARQLQDRLLGIQTLEALRCLDEQVITDPSEGDVGAVLGWNFAPWTGGPLSYIDMLGAGDFVARCDEFAARLGERFRVPDSLRRIAAIGGSVAAHRWVD